jgi:hypothetical protein
LRPEAVRAREILKPFKEGFLQALTSMLAQGPVPAIEGCRSVAPALAEAASTNGVRVGRTSHKLRNPQNAPKDWMEPFLDEFQKLPPDPSAFRVVKLPNGRVGYAEPIYVKPLCLTCHGSNLEPGLRAKLSELYPQDRATGFNEGDFRGLMWVELP